MLLQLLAIYFFTLGGAYFYAFRRRRTQFGVGLAGLAIVTLYFLVLLPGDVAGFSSSVFVNMITIGIILPMFAASLGWLAGAVAAALRNVPAIQAVAILASIVAPFAIYAAIDRNRAAERAEAAEKLQGFQRSTVSARLGRFDVTLPASPVIEAQYACKPEEDWSVRECWTRFSQQAGFGDLNGTGSDVPQIRVLRHVPVTDDCDVVSPHGACVATQNLVDWCAGRSDALEPIWCAPGRVHEIEFRADSEFDPTTVSPEGWGRMAPLGGFPYLECQTVPEGAECRAFLTIAEGVVARAWFKDVPLADLNREATRMHQHTKAIWQNIIAR